MNTPAQQAAFDAARATVAAQLGLPGFNTTDSAAQIAAYSALSAADQVRLTDALAAYITQNPASFSAATLSAANDRVTDPAYGKGLADTSWGAAISEFFSAANVNGWSIWNGLNTTLKILAVVLGLGLLAWVAWRFSGPRPRRN